MEVSKMEHTQPGERARIYDYRTGEEIRQATAKEEWRYIAQLLGMTGNQRMYGIVDGDEYGHDGDIYMQGGRVEIAAGIPYVDYDRAGQLWSEFVGSQGTDEFMRYSGTDNIRDAVEDYIDNMPEDWQEDAPEDLADMLTAYIERDVRMAKLLRVKKMMEMRLELTKGWTPKMIEFACLTLIRGTPEYQRGWEFGLKLGYDVDEAKMLEPFWASDYEWGDPATNYRTMTMLIEKTIEYNRESDGMGEYTLAADLGRWEGYNRSLLIHKMDHEIRPVPDMLVDELVEILREKAEKEDWRKN